MNVMLLLSFFDLAGWSVVCDCSNSWFPIKQADKPVHNKTYNLECTVKPVLSDHSKIDKTKVLMENGR